MNPLDFLAPRRGYDTRFDRNQVGTGGLSLQEDMDNYVGSKGKNLPSYGSESFGMNPIQDGDTFRMGIPKWAPGEFEEWKTAKMNGSSTQYGRNAQHNWETRMFPELQLPLKGLFNSR